MNPRQWADPSSLWTLSGGVLFGKVIMDVGPWIEQSPGKVLSTLSYWSSQLWDYLLGHLLIWELWDCTWHIIFFPWYFIICSKSIHCDIFLLLWLNTAFSLVHSDAYFLSVTLGRKVFLVYQNYFIITTFLTEEAFHSEVLTNYLFSCSKSRTDEYGKKSNV